MELRSQSLIVEVTGIGPVCFRRSIRARRLNVVLRPFRGIRVSVPAGVPLAQAALFVESKRSWIRENLVRLRLLEKEIWFRRVTMPAVSREEAWSRLAGRLADLATRHGYQYNRLTVRCQKTRWGSCSATNNISLNLKLLALPLELMDFVLLHELIHTRIKNHGPEFWAELERVAGSAREKAARLRHYSLAGP
jgi:predicted metal-dependent hydrolase